MRLYMSGLPCRIARPTSRGLDATIRFFASARIPPCAGANSEWAHRRLRLKLKRKNVEASFAAQIAALYDR